MPYFLPRSRADVPSVSYSRLIASQSDLDMKIPSHRRRNKYPNKKVGHFFTEFFKTVNAYSLVIPLRNSCTEYMMKIFIAISMIVLMFGLIVTAES